MELYFLIIDFPSHECNFEKRDENKINFIFSVDSVDFSKNKYPTHIPYAKLLEQV